MYDRFVKLCKENNVTPYRVAKETGITTATLSNWKAGRYTPKADKLQKICDFFKVPLEYLTGKGIVVKTISQELNDRLLKAYYEEENNEKQYPVYIKDAETGKRIAIGKVVDIEPYNEHKSSTKDNSQNDDNNFFNTLSEEEQAHIIDLYEKYQNASPEIRSAVELLLKAQSQES